MDLLLRRLAKTARLTGNDKKIIAQLPINAQTLSKGRQIVREGASCTRCFCVLDGMVAACKLVTAGRVQICAIYLPGDIPDLQNLHLANSDVEFLALTDCRIGFVPHTAIHEACEKSQGVMRALWRTSLIDAAILREWVTSLGQRTAREAMAHLICELFFRLRVIEHAEDHSFAFPLTQIELAQALGISGVHANRVCLELRRKKLIDLRRGHLRILDYRRLMQEADFNPTYLHLLATPGKVSMESV